MSEGSFYPKRKDVLDIDPSDILTRIQPSIATATGRTYTLSKKVVEDVTAALEVYLFCCNFAFLMVYLCYDIQLTPGGNCVNKQPKTKEK